MAENLTGKRFGRWTVLEPTKGKTSYYKCQCDCGTIKDVYRTTLTSGSSKGCSSCRPTVKHPTTTKKRYEKAIESIGHVINGWLVVDVLSEKKNGRFCCIAKCPKCGQNTKTALRYLTSKDQCPSCGREKADVGWKAKTVQSVAFRDGSSLPMVKAIVNGLVSSNSSTGINGVSFMKKNGKYRAYITFSRKTYSLGTYSTVEDAAAARKEAEKILYGKFLEQNEGWEDEVADALDAVYKKHDIKSSKKRQGGGNSGK